MTLLLWITWFGDLIALTTALALLKDTFFDRDEAKRIVDAAGLLWAQLRAPGVAVDREMVRPALQFGIRAVLLILIVASAGVCLVFPQITTWHGMLLRTALALRMASEVPCPWFRWITIGHRH